MTHRHTYLTLLKSIAETFGAAGLETPSVEAEIILSELLECSRPELIIYYNSPALPEVENRLKKVVKRRLKREPLQYILGDAYFMDLRLEVTPAVLIPRPETELLVEYICKKAPKEAALLDIGTGSGAIALAVAYDRPDMTITGVDISPDALAVAERNRTANKLVNVSLLQSDLFSVLSGRKFDCIAANLPYVSEEEYATLQPEVRDYEPKLALTAPNNGLDLTFKVGREAPDFLNPGGFIIFEIGETQAPAVITELEQLGRYSEVKSIKDYHRRDRFVLASIS
jgi:release factor glutamine methyltransferase